MLTWICFFVKCYLIFSNANLANATVFCLAIKKLTSEENYFEAQVTASKIVLPIALHSRSRHPHLPELRLFLKQRSNSNPNLCGLFFR
jgi:hypothetical protein